jgi:leucyl/phenylalanyl-tRNA--protein transferase
MPVFLLGKELVFPPPDLAEGGLLAVGGDLSTERLLLAYRSGIFPWYEDGYPILWHSPDPRCVFRTDTLHIGRSLRKVIRRGTFEVKLDHAFARVIRACKHAPRPGQNGTWITDEMERAYVRLHRQGYAHSVECWQDGELAGGLYGVSLGHVFFGESMFSREPDASKVALVALAQTIKPWGHTLIDAQVATPHTRSLGAEDWPRSQFLEVLSKELAHPSRLGSWAEIKPVLEVP